MKNLIGVFLIVLLFSTCSTNDVEPDPQCSIPATVRDMTGLDGCGFVFELNDGTRLIPYMLFFCGTPPLPDEVTEDPLYNFEFVDGKKVFIEYELRDQPNICMVGPVAKITCISDAQNPTPGESNQ